MQLGNMWGTNNMKNFRLKNSVYLLVFISAISWYVLALLLNVDISIVKDFFGLVPQIVTIDLFIIFIFTKWGWRFKVFRGWLVLFPDLNGTWIGNIYSDWINPETGEGVKPIPVMLTMYQSFSHISCIMHTGEMKSFSFAEGFNIDEDKQIKQIAYIYTSKPRIIINQRSLPHDGSIVFDIIESPEKKLNGRYWTERKTKGEIILTYYSKTILEEIPDSLENHPVTEKKNLRKR